MSFPVAHCGGRTIRGDLTLSARAPAVIAAYCGIAADPGGDNRRGDPSILSIWKKALSRAARIARRAALGVHHRRRILSRLLYATSCTSRLSRTVDYLSILP